ncbi:amidoligase family protein [Paenibacillus hamazuiensis]|uniref:amidoligase family protein n=1 Tax=Paenibacillus hamazuiensis TaxID=2936508 RepID=UPI00200BDB7C|nr:amidoligase family protein [Paenibacillus hamazuiensis]
MWPKTVDWKSLKFGVEIEFIGGKPQEVELLPGWIMSLDEMQIDETGMESGSELKPPPLSWSERGQIEVMLTRLRENGATVNWSCGLHVHVGLEPWGEDIVQPLLDAALRYQDSIRALVDTADHRLIFCPPVTEEMRRRAASEPCENALLRRGRPQSHRCGINLAAWYDIGTVEIRYANGSLDYDEILNTVELYLRFIAAIGAGRTLPRLPEEMAAELDAPAGGFPKPIAPPKWFLERMWLEELLRPGFASIAADLVPDGEVHSIIPVPEGLLVSIEQTGDGTLRKFVFGPPSTGWELLREI